MSWRVEVLCRPALAAGFQLSGLKPRTAGTPGEAARVIHELLARPEAGILLVEDGLFEALPGEFRRELARRALPLIVPFPGPRWAEVAEGMDRYIAELLRQAIGYRVRLT